jgi:hypothetical protein
LSVFDAPIVKVTDWPKTLDCEMGWVSIVGVTAGERVVTEAFALSSEFASEDAAIAVTLTKYSVPSAIAGKLDAVIVVLVPATPTRITAADPVPGAL